jgi:heme/copper-type cytochrome/quinol oxidase subunit 3
MNDAAFFDALREGRMPALDTGAMRWDERRGTRGMVFFIATEAMLFVALFFAYFYLGAGQPQWPMDEPPKLTLAFWMLGVLLSSSIVVYIGERVGRRGAAGTAKLLVAGGIALGIVFLVLQGFEYADHLRTLQPWDDAYASIFYTITSIHGLHVVLGLCMLGYTLLLPQPEHADKPPHKALHNAGMYWHFVDAVWILIVALLYVMPNVGVGG